MDETLVKMMIERAKGLVSAIQDELDCLDDRNLHVRIIEDIVIELKRLLGGTKDE